MVCVSYDHDFVQEMISKSNWEPRPKTQKKKQNGRKTRHDSDDEDASGDDEESGEE